MDSAETGSMISPHITFLFRIVLLTASLIVSVSCQKSFEINRIDIQNATHSEIIQDDLESDGADIFQLNHGCKHASAEQIAYINLGASKLNQFLKKCYSETNSKKWCDQVARPNPASHSTFDCTYSPTQPHFFIHPSESMWSNAIGAVKLVQELETKNIKIDLIYNWWRPEPYNANVGGAAGRHPFGTSVDVRFINKSEQNKAHAELCKIRKQGRLRALGYYSGTGLHFGMGDKVANTWGKPCP